MPPIPLLIILFAISSGLIYFGVNSLTYKGDEPILKLPEDSIPQSDFDTGKWLGEAPLTDISDFIFGGLVNTVEWAARGITGMAQTVVNWIISHLNPLFKTVFPFITIPTVFVKAIFIALLGLFTINQIKGLADKAYSGVTLFTAIIFTAIAALVIIIVFSSVFINP